MDRPILIYQASQSGLHCGMQSESMWEATMPAFMTKTGIAAANLKPVPFVTSWDS